MSNYDAKFYIGQLVATRGVADLMKGNQSFSEFVSACLRKYTKCDWGDTCKDDSAMNDDAVKREDSRLLAVYKFPKDANWTSEHFGYAQESIWIITESDHSSTTVLFPSEY